jgi:hypothetical protein
MDCIASRSGVPRQSCQRLQAFNANGPVGNDQYVAFLASSDETQCIVGTTNVRIIFGDRPC